MWTSKDRETIDWDGTMTAKVIKAASANFEVTFIDPMTSSTDGTRTHLLIGYNGPTDEGGFINKTDLLPDIIMSKWKFDNSGTPSVNKWAFYQNEGNWVGGIGFSTNSFDYFVGPGGGYSWWGGTTKIDGSGAGLILSMTAAGLQSYFGYISIDGSPGISATITTAKLTAGGANGSMTFKDGLLTAQTPAT